MAGSPYKLTVRSEMLERLSRHMPVRVPPDLSKQLATPMPGKLHSIAVKGASPALADRARPPGTACAHVRRVPGAALRRFARAGCSPSLLAASCEQRSSALTQLATLPEGDVVVAGQEMCVVEAMKMQNVLRCPKDTTVKQVGIRVLVPAAVLRSLSSLPRAAPAGCPNAAGAATQLGACLSLSAARTLCRLRRRLATIWHWTRSSCCLNDTVRKVPLVAPWRRAGVHGAILQELHLTNDEDFGEGKEGAGGVASRIASSHLTRYSRRGKRRSGALENKRQH